MWCLYRRHPVPFFPRHKRGSRELPWALFVHFFYLFVALDIQCPEMSKSGFKPCWDCHRQMSVLDLYRICLWCLGSDHESRDCAVYNSLQPKAFCERGVKLLMSWHKKAPRRSRSGSCRRSRVRLRSHSRRRSSSKSLSSKLAKTKKHQRRS